MTSWGEFFLTRTVIPFHRGCGRVKSAKKPDWNNFPIGACSVCRTICRWQKKVKTSELHNSKTAALEDLPIPRLESQRSPLSLPSNLGASLSLALAALDLEAILSHWWFDYQTSTLACDPLRLRDLVTSSSVLLYSSPKKPTCHKVTDLSTNLSKYFLLKCVLSELLKLVKATCKV